jgi:hypothetical protein
VESKTDRRSSARSDNLLCRANGPSICERSLYRMTRHLFFTDKNFKTTGLPRILNQRANQKGLG